MRPLDFTAPYAANVYAGFAGHYHIDQHTTRTAGGYEVFVTDATHDDENTCTTSQYFCSSGGKKGVVAGMRS